MTEPPNSGPPRLVPERPFPAYAYLPGRHPHPTRDPEGHSFGEPPETPDPPDPDRWRGCGDYLYGIDLFNHGFYWEAHEAWEGLWVACGREGATATFLQGLINLAAAGFKARWGNVRGLRANAGTALRLFRSASKELGTQGMRHMGLDLRALAETAAVLARTEPTRQDEKAPLNFDVVLRPD